MPSELYVDNWEVKKICEEKTGVDNLKYVCSGDILLERAYTDTYIGDIISKDRKNTKNIKGIVEQILNTLEGICFGPYEIEVHCS